MPLYNLSYPLLEIEKEPRVLALGYFDGIHRGHQEVLKKTKELALKYNSTPCVLTFHPHPSEILGKNPICRYITPLSEKVRQFHEVGIHHVFIMDFDLGFSQTSKEIFVGKVLGSFCIKGVVTGFNFRFGRGAKGQTEDLKQLSQDRFEVNIVDSVQDKGRVISSTRIRQALYAGEVEEVNEILGRPYAIEGEVVVGDQRGRDMGFPTANLSLRQPFIIPRHGVYVVRVVIDGYHQVTGVMNIGVRPTITQPYPEERLEVHLFDWNEEIYGKAIHVQFLHYLREEIKFSSIEALIFQIQEDIQTAKVWLSAFAMI